MAHTDLAMEKDAQGNYDLVIVDGLFKTTESFETAIQLLFFLDARAEPSEVPIAQNRRGWWGNVFNQIPNTELGNKLWLLFQARAIEETRLKAEQFVKQGFQQLVDSQHATKIEVVGELFENRVEINIKIFTNQDVIIEQTFTLWLNTKQV